jgi:hypothetical protein
MLEPQQFAAIIASSLLCMVLVAAAIAKLASGREARRLQIAVLVGNGRPAGVLAAGLPYIELTLGLAALQLTHWTAVHATIGFVLVVFSVGVLALDRRKTLDCGCFGETGHSQPREVFVVRNAMLVTAALTAAILPVAELSVGLRAAGLGVATMLVMSWVILASAYSWFREPLNSRWT